MLLDGIERSWQNIIYIMQLFANISANKCLHIVVELRVIISDRMK